MLRYSIFHLRKNCRSGVQTCRSISVSLFWHHSSGLVRFQMWVVLVRKLGNGLGYHILWKFHNVTNINHFSLFGPNQAFCGRNNDVDIYYNTLCTTCNWKKRSNTCWAICQKCWRNLLRRGNRWFWIRWCSCSNWLRSWQREGNYIHAYWSCLLFVRYLQEQKLLQR